VTQPQNNVKRHGTKTHIASSPRSAYLQNVLGIKEFSSSDVVPSSIEVCMSECAFKTYVCIELRYTLWHAVGWRSGALALPVVREQEESWPKVSL
jgi:hypothetical protein